MRTLLAILAVALTLPATALSSGDDVIRDCTDDGRISGAYTQSEYRAALSSISADTDEYTDCRGIIQRAQLGSAAGATGAGGPVNPNDPLSGATPQERAAVAQAIQDGSLPAVAAGEDGASVPAPMIAVLVLLVVAALALLAPHARISRLVRARRA